jgi:hypothetical protein
MSGNKEENTKEIFTEMPESPHIDGMNEPLPNLINPPACWAKEVAIVGVVLTFLLPLLTVGCYYLFTDENGTARWPWN